MERVENAYLAPFTGNSGDLKLDPVPTSNYYYTVTGDTIQGENTDLGFYTEFKAQRYPIGLPVDIRNQTDVWGPISDNETQPNDFSQFLAPIKNFFNGIAEGFIGKKK
jgi:hypothetical protein